MSIKTAMFAALSATGPTYPVVAPQGVSAPYVRYAGIGGRDAASFDADGMGATSGTIQVDAFARDYGTAEKLAQAARKALYDAPGVTVGEIIDLPDDYEVDTKLFKVSFQVEAWE